MLMLTLLADSNTDVNTPLNANTSLNATHVHVTVVRIVKTII